MAIYEMSTDKISEVYRTTFAALGIRERQDMQRILRQFIEVIAPDTMVLREGRQLRNPAELPERTAYKKVPTQGTPPAAPSISS